MQFTQNGTVPQLYLAADNSAAAARTIWYLLPPTAAQTPSSIAFGDAWSTYGGTYLFLEQPLPAGGEAAFATAAWAFLGDPRMYGVRFVWCNPPDASGLLSGTAIPLTQPVSGDPEVRVPVVFDFQNVSLVFGAATTVAIDGTNFAFRFSQAGAHSIYLTAGWGAVEIDAVGASVTLPFTGALAGSLQFTLQLTVQNQTDLDIGLRYFYAVPPDPSHPGAPATDFFLGSLRYPVFNEALTLYANLDPLAPLTAKRSFLAFNGADAGQPGASAPGPLDACYSSTMGDRFTLTPLTGASAPTGFSALVFATNQQAATPGSHDPLYLVPSGDFALQTARQGTVDFMCGLSGVEYLQLSGSANVLSFFPGKPAFAIGFLPGQPPGLTQLAPAVAPTTAFATVSVPGATVDYFAQPDQSILYNYNLAPPPKVTLPALAAVPVQAATLGAPTATPAFPLLPYTGLGGANLSPFQQMEWQVVSPARRLALANTKAIPQPPPPGQQSTYSTTPQGLLATYTPGGSTTSWDEIVLAQMQSTIRFLLTNVTGDLLTAFQSNKLFLVISDPASIQASLEAANSQIVIGADPSEPWRFNLNPAPPDSKTPSPWLTYGTILIVKFTNLSVANLAKQPSAWAFPQTFNQTPSATSQAIGTIISNAASSGDPDLVTFLAAVNDANWNGILMLNAMAPLTSLPPELAGLAVGIDPSKFFAHHIGINASLINVPTPPADLTISDSSIFGLINYKADQPLAPSGSGYQFQVEQLKVLFLNSDVASFSSIIDLQIDTLFGEPATLEGASDNVMRMYGVYQKHVVNGQTQESYVFQTAAGARAIFDVQSDVLNAVEITKGQFVTVTSESDSQKTDSQFVLWGLLDFKALPDFDIFSFGRPTWQIAPAKTGAVRASGVTTITTLLPHGLAAGDPAFIYGVADSTFNGTFTVAASPAPTANTFSYQQMGGPDAVSGGGASAGASPAGLSFSNLIIQMTFDPETLPAVPQFTFDASQLAFDLANSAPRDGSFFNHFPLTVAGFTQAEGGASPTELGFMGVQTPLNQSALAYPWFSLNFNLDLGTPGALAAQAGFVATLAAAWSPGGSSGYQVFVGLKLPGSSGSKRAITIEGIFDITFKTLQILAIPDKNAYILVLYNIGFKLLSFTFPPTGQVNFVLFGDPTVSTFASGGHSALGWYAAYAKPQTNGSKPSQDQLSNPPPPALLRAG